MQHSNASSDSTAAVRSDEPLADGRADGHGGLGERNADVQPEDLSAGPRPNSRKRSVFKTISWRITATTTTFLIAWVVTGDLGAGAAIGGVEAVAKMFLYYGHERAWEHVPA